MCKRYQEKNLYTMKSVSACFAPSGKWEYSHVQLVGRRIFPFDPEEQGTEASHHEKWKALICVTILVL